MLNQYQLTVRAICPIHTELIDFYGVTIKSPVLIHVEKILEVFKPYETQQVFQEKMTADVAVKLGASVMTVGTHAGVKVTCLAP